MNEPRQYTMETPHFKYAGFTKELSLIFDAAIVYVQTGLLKTPSPTPLVPKPDVLIKMGAKSVIEGKPVYEADGRNYEAYPQFKELVDLVADNIRSYVPQSGWHASLLPGQKQARR